MHILWEFEPSYLQLILMRLYIGRAQFHRDKQDTESTVTVVQYTEAIEICNLKGDNEVLIRYGMHSVIYHAVMNTLSVKKKKKQPSISIRI